MFSVSQAGGNVLAVAAVFPNRGKERREERCMCFVLIHEAKFVNRRLWSPDGQQQPSLEPDGSAKSKSKLAEVANPQKLFLHRRRLVAEVQPAGPDYAVGLLCNFCMRNLAAVCQQSHFTYTVTYLFRCISSYTGCPSPFPAVAGHRATPSPAGLMRFFATLCCQSPQPSAA